MPRRARIVLPNVPIHIIQRGNNRQACFYHDPDYRLYLEWLGEYAIKTGCQIHAYVLMTNHVHLLLTAQSVDGVGQLMKHLGQRYVQYINRTYRRSGTLWEGRFKSCLAQSEHYTLNCYRYIELNPVRAGMVDHPAEYRWSSYRCNAQGEKNRVIQAHSTYLELGPDAEHREMFYRDLFKTHMPVELVDEIRAATNGNYVLGDSVFREQVTATLGRRVVPGVSGRPRRTAG
jgi:putative transposase